MVCFRVFCHVGGAYRTLRPQFCNLRGSGLFLFLVFGELRDERRFCRELFVDGLFCNAYHEDVEKLPQLVVYAGCFRVRMGGRRLFLFRWLPRCSSRRCFLRTSAIPECSTNLIWNILPMIAASGSFPSYFPGICISVYTPTRRGFLRMRFA